MAYYSHVYMLLFRTSVLVAVYASRRALNSEVLRAFTISFVRPFQPFVVLRAKEHLLTSFLAYFLKIFLSLALGPFLSGLSWKFYLD